MYLNKSTEKYKISVDFYIVDRIIILSYNKCKRLRKVFVLKKRKFPLSFI